MARVSTPSAPPGESMAHDRSEAGLSRPAGQVLWLPGSAVGTRQDQGQARLLVRGWTPRVYGAWPRTA